MENEGSYGPMDKALVYETRDSRFDPWQDRPGLGCSPRGWGYNNDTILRCNQCMHVLENAIQTSEIDDLGRNLFFKVILMVMIYFPYVTLRAFIQ